MISKEPLIKLKDKEWFDKNTFFDNDPINADEAYWLEESDYKKYLSGTNGFISAILLTSVSNGFMLKADYENIMDIKEWGKERDINPIDDPEFFI